MNFQAAYNYIKRGHAMTLPEWGGFWKRNGDNTSINIHTRDGDVFDIRQTNDVDYTINFTFRDDWEFAEPDSFSQKEKNPS